MFVFVAVLLIAALVGLVFFYTFNYYRRIRSGQVNIAPIYTGNFTPTGAAGAATLKKFQDLIGSDSPSLGAISPKITIVEFGDFECPFTKQVYSIVRSLVAENSAVRLIWRDYPLEEINPHSRLAAIAASCAEASGRFWQMQDKLFANQNALEREDLIDYAGQIGLDKNDFRKCFDDGGNGARIARDIALGKQAGVRGTPTFFINGMRIEGAAPYELFKKIIEQLSK